MKLVYDVIYKGMMSQTTKGVASLQEAAEYIKNSGLNPDYFIIHNTFTCDEIRFDEIAHYEG